MIQQITINDALLKAAKEVFETMIFMDLEESSDPLHQIQGEALLGSITFKGEIEGCMSICCGVSCAKTIAANMLGMDVDEDISDDDVNDAIGEVANMVMGSVKKQLHGNIANLEVSIPSVVSGRELKSNLGERANRVLVKVNIEDQYTAELSFLYREANS